MRQMTESDLEITARAMTGWLRRYPENGTIQLDDVLKGIIRDLKNNKNEEHLIFEIQGVPEAYIVVKRDGTRFEIGGGRLTKNASNSIYREGIAATCAWVQQLEIERSGRFESLTFVLRVWKNHYRLRTMNYLNQRIGFRKEKETDEFVYFTMTTEPNGDR